MYVGINIVSKSVRTWMFLLELCLWSGCVSAWARILKELALDECSQSLENLACVSGRKCLKRARPNETRGTW